MPPLRLLLVVVAGAMALGTAGSASASASFGDRDVRDPSLEVGAGGIALVTYTTAAGERRHVLVWGAVDAAPNPTAAPAQQAFSFDYSGGWKSRGNPRFWRTIRNGCTRYDGPPLPLLVAACRAPDGSYWALQAWQRNLPMRGFAPWTDAQRAVELHVSHWRGGLPALEIHRAYTYGNAHQGFFGRFVYHGAPVFGTRSSSGRVTDPWARNISIDVLDSDYGRGWRHDTAIATHSGNGGFCYTFVPQAPPAGYPSRRPNGNGLGQRYRITVMGPGVTPVVRWQGPRLGSRSARAQAAAAARFDQILGGDARCAPERPS